jgi:sulfite exporter TauE/SafE
MVMGLSASLVCMGWCIPVIMPYAAVAKKPGVLSGFITTGLFSLGRLASYAVFVGLFFALKEILPIDPVFGVVATVLSGLILILSGLSFNGVIKIESKLGKLVCRRTAGTDSPLFLGVLTGLRPCAPLLAAMTFVIALQTILEAGVFLISFWIASSAIVIALGTLGGAFSMLLSKKIGIDRLRSIIGMAMIFIGVFLILLGIGGLQAGGL